MKKLHAVIVGLLILLFLPSIGQAQEKEFSFDGYIQMQAGIFVPLASNGFEDYDNIAYGKSNVKDEYDTSKQCDPVNYPTSCYTQDHGGKSGKPSMMRGTLQLMAEWRPEERILVHAVVRAVGSLKLDLDRYAQPPEYPDGVDKREYAMNYVQSNFYNEVDLREFYVDIEATNWLSFRLGRQQVVWGDINSYRLLDVINPENSSWHFGPLESFEDTRIPLWMAKAMIEFKDIDHSLELVWVPGIDRDEDTVTVPLTMVGAWGLPLSNTPSPFVISKKKFLYPGNAIEDQRIGIRWKGNINAQSSYSLLYYYTHMISPPIPLYFDLVLKEDGFPKTDMDGNQFLETLYLGFPRQHIIGGSIDYAFESPIGMVAKLEASVEPDRTYPRQSKTNEKYYDPEYMGGNKRQYFDQPKYCTINYAVQIMRPTMIRWLNPTQNTLFVLQWQHSIIPNLSEKDKQDVVAIPGFNDYKLKKHSFTGVFVMGTTYLHGMLTPKVVAAYIHPRSGFIAGSVDLRLGRHWRLRFQVTDFFGEDPYKALGLFRDRDELNLRIRYQF